MRREWREGFKGMEQRNGRRDEGEMEFGEARGDENKM